MTVQIDYSLLNSIFDQFIIADIQKRVDNIDTSEIDNLANCMIEYVHKHYNVDNKSIFPKISNFYGKHKKFTRFILISISLFSSTDNIRYLLKKYRFNEPFLWEVEHIVPQAQNYNQFNARHSKLKNQLGNLTLLTKQTNVAISNGSFFKKCHNLSENELSLKVNDVFQHPKINFSKKDIKNREEILNDFIFNIFIKNDGLILRTKLQDLVIQSDNLLAKNYSN